MREIAKKTALVVVAVLIAFVLADTALRLVARHTAAANPEETMFRTDPDIGAWVHVPNSSAIVQWRWSKPHRVSFNTFGCRGPYPKTLEKPAGVIRIIVLGESSTEGGLVEDGKTWPEVLQRELDHAIGTGRVEVINFGTSGYSSLISVKNFQKRGIPLKPDIVIVYHGNNDLFTWLQERFKADLSVDESYVDYEARAAPWCEKLLCKSIIIDRINRNLYSQNSNRSRKYLDEYWADSDKTTVDLTGVERNTIKSLSDLYCMG